VLNGLVMPLDRANVDTDQIIPKEYLASIKRTGFAAGLFGAWRKDPQFVLNQPRYRGAQILLARENFGCGSSREHAPWALMDFGIKAVISTSFADIFYNNCFQNGLLPVVLKADQVQQLMEEARGGNHVVSVDLEAQTVTSPSGAVFAFDIDPKKKAKMLHGLDQIGETLQAAASIDTYEMKRALSQPWLEGA
jgi:3-isopropylmalate dehydratase/3-isopropylmalate/(R)-2-methylmalate dehydratase small subunit